MTRSLKNNALPSSERLVTGQRGEAVRRTILDAALRLIARQGIAATSIDHIVEEAQVARMTLYNHFPSKERLVLDALVHEGARWRRYFFAELASSTGSPRKRLLSVFDIFERWFEGEDYCGCAFMNALLAHYMPNDEVLSATLAHKRPVLDQLEALARAAGAADPEGLTRQIDILLNGAIVSATMSRSSWPAKAAREIAAHLLDASLP